MSRTLFVGLVAALSLSMVGCKNENADKPKLKVGKLEVIDEKVGEGPAAEKGDGVLLLYEGTLDDGTKFDSNTQKNAAGQYEKLPYGVIIGESSVIDGWQEGLVGMKKGGVRKLVVPPNLAYGLAGQPPVIPSNATLHFKITMVDMVKKGHDADMDVKEIKAGTGKEVKQGSKVEIAYKSLLPNGIVYEDSETFEMKMEFVVGDKHVMDAINLGIVGMKEGGVRELRMPWSLWTGKFQRVYLPPPHVLYYQVTVKKVY